MFCFLHNLIHVSRSLLILDCQNAVFVNVAIFVDDDVDVDVDVVVCLFLLLDP